MRLNAPKVLNKNKAVSPALQSRVDPSVALAPALRTLQMLFKKGELEAKRILGIPLNK